MYSVSIVVKVSFEEDYYLVSEGDSTVELSLIATGAYVDTPFSVRVSTRDFVPPSAEGEK